MIKFLYLNHSEENVKKIIYVCIFINRADVAEEEVSTVLDYALQDTTWSFESKKEALTQLSEVLRNTRLLASVVISLAQLFLSSNRPLQAVRILQDNIQVS